MNKNTVEAAMLSQGICNRFYNDYDNVETVLCPPFISLKTVATVLDYDKADIALGA
ncbi:MAG TPA: triose-phosphate isomerase, partial [Coriobacteriia bacterium]|nr:triose-phosphate isomerase [Coriobacteriia bacterium]